MFGNYFMGSKFASKLAYYLCQIRSDTGATVFSKNLLTRSRKLTTAARGSPDA